MSKRYASVYRPNDYNPQDHLYPRVRNANLHPLIKYFLSLSNERIIDRYCHLHPEIDKEKLRELMKYKATHFQWSGADLFPVTTEKGRRQMILIETNSCPSGQKSTPLFDETDEYGGYKRLLEASFLPRVRSIEMDGALAVIYDKNKMEATGYAATLADLTGEDVYIAEFYVDDTDPPVKFEDGILYLRNDSEEWIKIRAAFKYVTQKPWNRIPLITKTYIFNPVICCLSGGRNKLVAAKAYQFFNGDVVRSGLEIKTPETILDLSKNEIRFWIQKLGGFGVIKVPYSNAGQGVYTITNQEELNDFLKKDFDYDIFILQSLIGNSKWSSVAKGGSRLYHIGTVPNKKNRFYVADLRMMIACTENGYRPIAIYARRARDPLQDDISGTNSWNMLGTNLSVKNEDGTWGTDTDRLLLMDNRDFNQIGIGLDDLIEAFIQTLLAAIAIDRMAVMLLSEDRFKPKLFRSLDPDEALIDEIMNY